MNIPLPITITRGKDGYRVVLPIKDQGYIHDVTVGSLEDATQTIKDLTRKYRLNLSRYSLVITNDDQT